MKTKTFLKVWHNSIRIRQRLTLLCLVALLSFASAALAQQQTKRPITHSDYDAWRTIQGPQISRDGKYVAYAFLPEDGDGEVVVRNVASGIEWRAPRGYHPPVPPPDDPGANIGEFQAAQARLVRPVFTADNRFVVFSIEPTRADVSKAKKAGSSPTPGSPAGQPGWGGTVREGSSGSPTLKDMPKNAALAGILRPLSERRAHA